MSYRVHGASEGDPAPHFTPVIQEGSSDNDHIQQAEMKIKLLIDKQHSDLKGKFDQIRLSLGEKENQVHQELDQILKTRLDELDECARNIHVLNDTYKLNKQKLDTKTLGAVNLKVLTTMTESIESFRKRISTELNIRILWGSQNIEQSIHDICTISYASEAEKPQEQPLLCKCVYCNVILPANELTKHNCVEEGNAASQELPRPSQIPARKDPATLQAVPPAFFEPIPAPTPTRQLLRDMGRLEAELSSESNSLLFCSHCQQYFSSAEMESHLRQIHTMASPRRPSPVKPDVVDLPPPLSKPVQMQVFQPGGQQQLSAALHEFAPVSQSGNPPASPYHAQSKISSAPPSLQPVYSPLDQHPIPQPFDGPAIPQPMQRVDLNKQPQMMSGSPQYTHAQYQYQNQGFVVPQPNAALPLPQAHDPVPVPREQKASTPPYQYRMESIRKYKRRLLWFKQLDTMSDRVFYFDNFDGGFELVWDRRQVCYVAEAEFEEGEHFGQLSLMDSEVIYPVNKFIIRQMAAASSQVDTVRLDVVDMKFNYN